MTQLSKKVSRESTLEFDRRKIIIEIEPPGNLSFRMKGTRKRWSAPASLLMQWIIQADVEARMSKKRRVK